MQLIYIKINQDNNFHGLFGEWQVISEINLVRIFGN